MNSTREERPRRRRLVPAFVVLGLGLLFLVIGLNRPTIANMRSVRPRVPPRDGGVPGCGPGGGWSWYFAGRRKG